MPDRRHLLVVLALATVAGLAVLLALSVTPWALIALPFCLVGGVGAWSGMSLERFFDAVSDDDPGRGVAGLLP